MYSYIPSKLTQEATPLTPIQEMIGSNLNRIAVSWMSFSWFYSVARGRWEDIISHWNITCLSRSFAIRSLSSNHWTPVFVLLTAPLSKHVSKVSVLFNSHKWGMERKYTSTGRTSVEETMLQNILYYIQFRLFAFLMTLSKLQPSVSYNVACT
jgi:hypothetical protein